MGVEYSEELAAKICEQLASGRTLSSICKAPGMPSRVAVWKWSKRYPEFRDEMTRARLAGADILADETVDIADTEDDPQRAKNRIEARRWLAGVINPRRYGPRLDLNVSESPNVGEALREARNRLPESKRQALEQQPPAPDRTPGLWLNGKAAAAATKAEQPDADDVFS